MNEYVAYNVPSIEVWESPGEIEFVDVNEYNIYCFSNYAGFLENSLFTAKSEDLFTYKLGYISSCVYDLDYKRANVKFAGTHNIVENDVGFRFHLYRKYTDFLEIINVVGVLYADTINIQGNSITDIKYDCILLPPSASLYSHKAPPADLIWNIYKNNTTAIFTSNQSFGNNLYMRHLRPDIYEFSKGDRISLKILDIVGMSGEARNLRVELPLIPKSLFYT